MDAVRAAGAAGSPPDFPTDEFQELLAAAELWAWSPDAPDTGPDETRTVSFVAGWEDGYHFCHAVCATDLGRALCARCPEQVVASAAASNSVRRDRCPAGVRLLAFPLDESGQVGVLRVGPPARGLPTRIAGQIRVPAAALEAAAAERPAARPSLVREAACVLASRGTRLGWLARQRDRSADDRRAAVAAGAQVLATIEDLQAALQASERQRGEIERQRRRLDRLARESLRASNEERARIAHEIHDTTAQSLVSAYRFLDAARASAMQAGLPASIERNLAEASDRLLTAIRELRAVLTRMTPPGLDELGLADAIRIRLSGMRAEGMEGTVVADLPRLHDAAEQALYRMAVEALSNALRHGKASRVDVTLQQSRGRAILTVADNGVGFDPRAGDRRRDGTGMGLLGMSRQAGWLGGRMTISSRPGAGTRVRISIPLTPNREDG